MTVDRNNNLSKLAEWMGNGYTKDDAASFAAYLIDQGISDTNQIDIEEWNNTIIMWEVTDNIKLYKNPSKNFYYSGHDIYLAYMQDESRADAIFAQLDNPFEARRILIEAGNMGVTRLPVGCHASYFAWLGSLARIVVNNCDQEDCHRAGIKPLSHRRYGEWVEDIKAH